MFQTVGGVEKGDPAFLDVESISRKHNLAKKKAFVAAGNLEGVSVLVAVCFALHYFCVAPPYSRYVALDSDLTGSGPDEPALWRLPRMVDGRLAEGGAQP